MAIVNAAWAWGSCRVTGSLTFIVNARPLSAPTLREHTGCLSGGCPFGLGDGRQAAQILTTAGSATQGATEAMTTPEPRRCSTAAGVTAAIRAIQPVLAARPPLHLAHLAALLGQIRGRRIRLIGTSLLPLPQPQMVTALWTQAPERDYLFHDDRMAGTHYHHDVVLHTLSHIFLDHAAPMRAGADAVLGTLFDASGRAMLCPAGVLAVAEVSVEAETAAEADADMLAAWLADSTDLPGDGERRRLAMTQLPPGDPHRTRRLEGGRWLQMLTTAPEAGCAL